MSYNYLFCSYVSFLPFVDIDKLRSDTPLSLHSLCDVDHPLNPSALILLTIDGTNFGMYPGCEQTIYKYFFACMYLKMEFLKIRNVFFSLRAPFLVKLAVLNRTNFAMESLGIRSTLVEIEVIIARFFSIFHYRNFLRYFAF